MKNHKQLLADFYLELLSIPDKFSLLKMTVLTELCVELQEPPDVVERIFERMAQEDKING